jgi:2-dehydropantoate 2-reductase
MSGVNDSNELIKTRVLILGAGAIGGFYGHALASAGADVSVVCRSEYDLVKESGYQLMSKTRGDTIFKPAQVLKSAADYQGGSPDYLIVTLKITQGIDRVALMKPVVGPSTVIVLIENGVEIEQEIQAAFPNNEIISCLAFIQVSRLAPGVIRHFAYGDLTIGNFPSGISQACQKFSAMLEAGNVKAPATESVVNARWQKCVWNASFNPVSVLGGPVDTITLLNSPGGEQLIRDLMMEVSSIALSTGNKMPDELIDRYIAATKNAPPYKTSMALDKERGQAMEVEVILGNTVRAGRRASLDIPKLESVYALMQALVAMTQTHPS